MPGLLSDTDGQRATSSLESDGQATETTRLQSETAPQEMDEPTSEQRAELELQRIAGEYGLKIVGITPVSYSRDSEPNQSNTIKTLVTPAAFITNYLSQVTGLELSEIYALYSDSSIKMYKTYRIKQGRRGKLRNIEEPLENLKEAQRALVPILELFPLTDSCTAKKGSSAVLNASRHKNAKHVLRVDIKSCYPSTHQHQVSNAIVDYSDGLFTQVLLTLERLCFIRVAEPNTLTPHANTFKWILPTGAPTSPMLCNIALTPVDFAVEDMLELEYSGKYTYTRYLDDLVISTTQETRDWEILDKVTAILNYSKWETNKKKSRWLTANESDNLIVTGVRVGDTYGIPRDFHRTVRARLQNLAIEGEAIDAETMGCLAYIKSVDEKRHQSLLDYYDRRLHYVPSPEAGRANPQ